MSLLTFSRKSQPSVDRPREPDRYRRRELSPPRMLAVSFLALVLLGTLGFKVLPGLYAEGVEPLGWLDALFTATSAVCVTGLIVVDTATYFSHVGQAYVLLLIQAGGLGMLGLASFIIITFRSRLSLRQDDLTGGSQAMTASQNVDTRHLVRDVLVFTAVAEGVGFLFLWVLWWRDFGPGLAAWHALFHSVSAFCNAGFSTFSDSLVSYRTRPLILLAISGGVIVGGLGFLTLEELKQWARLKRRKRAFRLSLHTRIVLMSTVLLIVAGAGILGALEWANPRTLGPLDVQDKLTNAVFLSITPRTAGFNTIDYGATLQGTNFTTILLMSIGGAPGGTAGGIKVTTVAILVIMAMSRLRARSTVDLWDRTIPAVTSQRATGLFVFSFSLVTAGVLFAAIVELDQRIEPLPDPNAPDGFVEAEGPFAAPLPATRATEEPATQPATQPTSQPATQPATQPAATQPYDPRPQAEEEIFQGPAGGTSELTQPVPAPRPIEDTAFLDVMFEATSAFNTVGLSTGITPNLTDAGRLLTVVLMFVGRVGPLTIAAALSQPGRSSRTFRRYAHEDVVVG